jgi:putative SOS response-associated peptidase YedK
MCSRYSLTTSPDAVKEYFGLSTIGDFPPRDTIGPTEPVAIVRLSPTGERELRLVRWGIIPAWVKHPRDLQLIINIRADTVSEKPGYRGALYYRRCVVPASAFMVWTGPAKQRRPYVVRPRDGQPLALAGLAEHWLGADGSEIETMAILTVAANATIVTLSDRMPAILPRGEIERWLDCRHGALTPVDDMLRPSPVDLLETIAFERPAKPKAAPAPGRVRTHR